MGFPTVTLAILVKQKERALPLYLACLEALDYPKDKIHLYVRTNDNTDRSAEILKAWVDRVGTQYAAVDYDDRSINPHVADFAPHEWNGLRFEVLGKIRQQSLQYARKHTDYYFVVDADNWIKPHTLRALVELEEPIVAPFLKHTDSSSPYSNFHCCVDPNGYFMPCGGYRWMYSRECPGVYEVGVVHCTYLVDMRIAVPLRYIDGTGRYEYVIFSHSARQNDVPQFLDTRDVYGYLNMTDDAEAAARLLRGE